MLTEDAATGAIANLNPHSSRYEALLGNDLLDSAFLMDLPGVAASHCLQRMGRNEYARGPWQSSSLVARGQL